MGSQTDFKTMKLAQQTLKKLKVPLEIKIISAHRTPMRMYEYASNAEKNNIGVIIAGAGGSAHLPGMIAALTQIPVLGVPIESKKLKGLDSLLSIAQMPKGIPVGTLAIGEDGAINAAILAASIISNNNTLVRSKLKSWRISQTKSVRKNNIGVIIAGAGGSAHLPGMISALTSIPVLGVPIESKKLKGLDSLLSIAQMPKGIPVGTLAIGEDGAINAGLLAASIIANINLSVKKKLNNWRLKQTKSVKKKPK